MHFFRESSCNSTQRNLWQSEYNKTEIYEIEQSYIPLAFWTKVCSISSWMSTGHVFSRLSLESSERMNFWISDWTAAPWIDIGSIVHKGSRDSIRATSLRLVTATRKLIAAHSFISPKTLQRSLLSPFSLGHSSKASMMMKVVLWPLIKFFIVDKSRSVGG